MYNNEKAKEIFYVWKNPECKGVNHEYLELSKEQYYEFKKKPENKSRRFIALDGDGFKDVDIITIEVTEEKYKKWKSEKNHKYYEYKKAEEENGREIQLLDIDRPISDNSDITFADVLGDDFDVEAIVENNELHKKLQKIIQNLSEDEKEIIHYLFFYKRYNKKKSKYEFLGEAEVSRMLNIPKSTLNYQKKKILNKIEKDLEQK